VIALLIETVDPYPVADADLVADGPNMRRLRHHRYSPEWIWAHPLPIAWPRGLDPDPPSGSAHPAFEPAPKLHQLAVVPDELRQHLGADHGHMAACVAAEPDEVAFDQASPRVPGGL
jgi:hypothetical protein